MTLGTRDEYGDARYVGLELQDPPDILHELLVSHAQSPFLRYTTHHILQYKLNNLIRHVYLASKLYRIRFRGHPHRRRPLDPPPRPPAARAPPGPWLHPPAYPRERHLDRQRCGRRLRLGRCRRRRPPPPDRERVRARPRARLGRPRRSLRRRPPHPAAPLPPLPHGPPRLTSSPRGPDPARAVAPAAARRARGGCVR